MSLCDNCTLGRCSPRCPYEMSPAKAATCRKCGEPIYEGDDALPLASLIDGADGYVCADCISKLITELWIEE